MTASHHHWLQTRVRNRKKLVIVNSIMEPCMLFPDHLKTARRKTNSHKPAQRSYLFPRACGREVKLFLRKVQQRCVEMVGWSHARRCRVSMRSITLAVVHLCWSRRLYGGGNRQRLNQKQKETENVWSRCAPDMAKKWGASFRNVPKSLTERPYRQNALLPHQKALRLCSHTLKRQRLHTSTPWALTHLRHRTRIPPLPTFHCPTFKKCQQIIILLQHQSLQRTTLHLHQLLRFSLHGLPPFFNPPHPYNLYQSNVTHWERREALQSRFWRPLISVDTMWNFL